MKKALAKTTGADGTVDHAVRTVFRRCLLFYLAAGIEESALLQEFALAMTWAKTKKVKAKIFRAGCTRKIFEICQVWMRDPQYVNLAGNPINLPRRGSTSIHSIMKQLSVTDNVDVIVRRMLQIGSVTRTRDGKLSLATKGFYSRRDRMVAFEPYANFLAQAVTTATLPIDVKRSDKHSYWLSATRNDLTDKQMAEFVQFIRRKGHSQLMELDEWFLAMDNSASGNIPVTSFEKTPKNTVGVGMFTFVTEPDSP